MCVPFCAQPLETVGQCSAGDIRDMNTLDILITNRILGQWDSKGDIGDRLTRDILITKRVELYKVGDVLIPWNKVTLFCQIVHSLNPAGLSE